MSCFSLLYELRVKNRGRMRYARVKVSSSSEGTPKKGCPFLHKVWPIQQTPVEVLSVEVVANHTD